MEQIGRRTGEYTQMVDSNGSIGQSFQHTYGCLDKFRLVRPAEICDRCGHSRVSFCVKRQGVLPSAVVHALPFWTVFSPYKPRPQIADSREAYKQPWREALDSGVTRAYATGCQPRYDRLVGLHSCHYYY